MEPNTAVVVGGGGREGGGKDDRKQNTLAPLVANIFVYCSVNGDLRSAHQPAVPAGNERVEVRGQQEDCDSNGYTTVLPTASIDETQHSKEIGQQQRV